ncbi:MAG: VWA domain-containing protein [Labilithrix sp.]|nr:VWA domain-containing protein [Labilithrix sp.]MCW5815606.1 VWA domain-containing protein [Labilithrix sp.]
MSKRALVTMLCAVLFMLLPRAARAGGTLYLASDASGNKDTNGTKALDTELPLERTDVELDVAGSIVGATVTQRFKNTYDRPIEVVYVFPLAQRAAVDAMEMKVGKRTITGSVAPREEARAAYTAALHDGRRAALLEQERPNMFTFSVGNIDPGASIDVKLHYFEVAQYDHGTYELVVPTTIGPRFIPAKGVPDADRVTPGYSKSSGAKIGIVAKIDGGAKLESVSTPAWDTEIKQPTAGVAEVKLKNGDLEIPNRDFVLRWRLEADSFASALFTHRSPEDKSGSGYLTLMLEPKHDVVPSEIAPRELVFLLDTSGSMRGPPLAAAVKAVNHAIDELGPHDTFQIIDFADTASTFAPRPIPNTPENRRRGHDYISHLRASGGTNQLAGIHAALSLPGDESRTRYVVFMTDGFIGNDAEVIALTRREIGRAHVFSFGVGSSVNRYLLDEVAIAGRGYAEYMRGDDAAELVDRFYTRIGLPFLTDIEIDWGGLAVTDTRPTALPDLSALSPLVLHARYTKPGEGDVTIKGRVGGRPRTQKLHVVLPAEARDHGAIEKLWARETIAGLERVPRAKLNVVEITRVAVTHGLMSKYTSFVAIDSAGPGNDHGSPLLVNQPSQAPADLDLESAGGRVLHAEPMESHGERYALIDAAPHHGGCAGCTTAPTPRSPSAALTLALALLVLIQRRRLTRRGRFDQGPQKRPHRRSRSDPSAPREGRVWGGGVGGEAPDVKCQ